MSADTVFWIASCSKLVTTVAALQCVERGQIALEDTVEEVLPELREPHLIGPKEQNFDGGRAAKKITLRHLLTHTSGVGYDMFHPLMLEWRSSRGEQPLGLSGRVVAAYSTPLEFEPGEGWTYGGGLDWAGVLVARLNGMASFEEYLQEHVFRPLHMRSTTFRLAQHPDIAARLAKVSAKVGPGQFVTVPRPFPENAAEDAGGAGLFSSVEDYLQLLGDLLKPEPTVLRAETVDLMFTPQFDESSKPAAGLAAQGDILDKMTGIERVAERGVTFGLGGLLLTEDRGGAFKGTLTWGGLPNWIWSLNRELGLATVFAAQMVPPGDDGCAKLNNKFIQSVRLLLQG